MEYEAVSEEVHQRSLAATFTFLIVFAFHFASNWIDNHFNQRSEKEKENQLRAEIKQLLKEANSLSQPATFAQASKLKRVALAKEKELAKYQDSYDKDKTSYSQALLMSKVFTYLILLIWFWRAPVASISQQLVQPFGRVLSWWTGGVQNNNIMVGIIPWLVVSTRVSKFICRLVWSKSNVMNFLQLEWRICCCLNCYPGFRMERTGHY